MIFWVGQSSSSHLFCTTLWSRPDLLNQRVLLKVQQLILATNQSITYRWWSLTFDHLRWDGHTLLLSSTIAFLNVSIMSAVWIVSALFGSALCVTSNYQLIDKLLLLRLVLMPKLPPSPPMRVKCYPTCFLWRCSVVMVEFSLLSSSLLLGRHCVCPMWRSHHLMNDKRPLQLVHISGDTWFSRQGEQREKEQR